MNISDLATNNIIRNLIPKPIHPILWNIACLGTDVFDLLLKRRDELTPPCKLRCGVGHYADIHSYKEKGEVNVEFLTSLGGVKPSDDVLDVGCGCGKEAAYLTKYLYRSSRYEGFDVAPQAIEWCKTYISSRYPNFHFQTADVFNKRYNPHGKFRVSEYRFPYGNESFDVVCLFSVFTHMLPQDMENYLLEITRVLKVDGRCFITFFLLNRDSLESINGKKSALDFKHDFGLYRTVNPNTPEESLCYDEEFVLGLYEKYNLKIKHLRYGSWSRTKYREQDIIVALKK